MGRIAASLIALYVLGILTFEWVVIGLLALVLVIAFLILGRVERLTRALSVGVDRQRAAREHLDAVMQARPDES